MKKYINAIILFLLGFGCLIAFKIIGSELTSDGILIEPFGLIPIGYLFITIGAITSIVLYVFSKKIRNNFIMYVYLINTVTILLLSFIIFNQI